jgi:hypothetical protein
MTVHGFTATCGLHGLVFTDHDQAALHFGLSHLVDGKKKYRPMAKVPSTPRARLTPLKRKNRGVVKRLRPAGWTPAPVRVIDGVEHQEWCDGEAPDSVWLARTDVATGERLQPILVKRSTARVVDGQSTLDVLNEWTTFQADAAKAFAPAHVEYKALPYGGYSSETWPELPNMIFVGKRYVSKTTGREYVCVAYGETIRLVSDDGVEFLPTRPEFVTQFEKVTS